MPVSKVHWFLVGFASALLLTVFCGGGLFALSYLGLRAGSIQSISCGSKSAASSISPHESLTHEPEILEQCEYEFDEQWFGDVTFSEGDTKIRFDEFEAGRLRVAINDETQLALQGQALRFENGFGVRVLNVTDDHAKVRVRWPK